MSSSTTPTGIANRRRADRLRQAAYVTTRQTHPATFATALQAALTAADNPPAGTTTYRRARAHAYRHTARTHPDTYQAAYATAALDTAPAHPHTRGRPPRRP